MNKNFTTFTAFLFCAVSVPMTAAERTQEFFLIHRPVPVKKYLSIVDGPVLAHSSESMQLQEPKKPNFVSLEMQCRSFERRSRRENVAGQSQEQEVKDRPIFDVSKFNREQEQFAEQEKFKRMQAFVEAHGDIVRRHVQPAQIRAKLEQLGIVDADRVAQQSGGERRNIFLANGKQVVGAYKKQADINNVSVPAQPEKQQEQQKISSQQAILELKKLGEAWRCSSNAQFQASGEDVSKLVADLREEGYSPQENFGHSRLPIAASGMNVSAQSRAQKRALTSKSQPRLFTHRSIEGWESESVSSDSVPALPEMQEQALKFQDIPVMDEASASTKQAKVAHLIEQLNQAASNHPDMTQQEIERQAVLLRELRDRALLLHDGLKELNEELKVINGVDGAKERLELLKDLAMRRGLDQWESWTLETEEAERLSSRKLR